MKPMNLRDSLSRTLLPRALGLGLAAALTAVALTAAPGAADAKVTALVGGTVHTVSGAVIPDGTVLVDGTRIAAVGTDVAVPPDAERVDVSGLHVYPGLIAAQSVLGLVDVGSVRGSDDRNETGDLNPNARAQVALHTDSDPVPVTRANGVLTALSVTGGGVLSGTSVVWNLDGWTWEDMTVVADEALHIHWPSPAPARRWGPQRPEAERRKDYERKLEELRKAFGDARAYMKARDAMAAGGPFHEADVRWEAMIPALERTMPVFIHADEYEQIEGALDFAKDESLRVVIVGGRDAPRLADRLAEARVPVIVYDVLAMPRRSWEPYDAAFTVAERLREAGVKYCIAGETASNLRNLPYHAAMAAAYGLPHDEALRAVTLYPAQILGIDDRLGSIDPGKDANLIVTDGDPLDIRSHVVKEWIEGRRVSLETKHTRLYDHWRKRPRPDGSESRLHEVPGLD
jgi:imidazolonepropionase-like amidohydrolase